MIKHIAPAVTLVTFLTAISPCYGQATVGAAKAGSSLTPAVQTVPNKGPKSVMRAKVSVDQLRNIRAIKGTNTRVELKPLSRAQISLDPALRNYAPVDMSGWTPVTAGGATGAPELIAQDKPYLLVRGKDKVTYAAPVNLLVPAAIDSQSWQVFDQNAERVSCVTSGAAQSDCISSYADGSAKAFFVFSDAPDKPGLSRTDGHAFPVQATASASFGAWSWNPEQLELVTAVYNWDGKQALKVGTAQSYLALADNGDAYFDSDTSDWHPTPKPFYAYAPTSDCAQTTQESEKNPSYCVFGDGAGFSLSLFRTTVNDLEFGLTKVVDLPAIPDGGGMRKGEAAIALLKQTLYVFARGKDGKLYMSTGAVGGTSFSAWKSLGGFVKEGSAPSCDPFGDGVTCAIRGADNRIYLRRISGSKNTSGL